jgi:DNA-binding NarL/FixJ family response regulator
MPASDNPSSREKASAGGDRVSGQSSILIVEDDFLIAMEAEHVLTDAGFRLAGIAASADDAIAMAERYRPAFAIMDIRLVGQRDGVDAALELFGRHGIRCIFATAHSDQEVLRRAEPACPLGWLQKPYTMPSLVAAVRRALDEVNST